MGEEMDLDDEKGMEEDEDDETEQEEDHTHKDSIQSDFVRQIRLIDISIFVSALTILVLTFLFFEIYVVRGKS